MTRAGLGNLKHNGPKWEDWEMEYLELAYTDTPIAVIAEKLDRTRRAIVAQAHRMALRHYSAPKLPRE